MARPVKLAKPMLFGAVCAFIFTASPSMALAGEFRVLYSFEQKGINGWPAQSPLLMDAAGKFYGTTYEGGEHRAGTVYEVTAGGTETALHAFRAKKDGGFSASGLIADQAGNLYGMTQVGDGTGCDNVGCGTVFELSTGGSFTVLHAFNGTTDGGRPQAALIGDKAGNLYGTTV